MVHRVNSSHIGCCLSIADILSVLYGKVLRVSPSTFAHPNRDRFILSKGHAAAIYYAVLAHAGFFDVEELETYYRNGSHLAGHATSHGVPGVECSTGSLGHGLSIGCGLALAQATKHAQNSTEEEDCPSTFVLLGDGECNEGSVWEAISFAAHKRLTNLIAIVDCNGIQSLGSCDEVQDMSPLKSRWEAFGWDVLECNGHAHEDLIQNFMHARQRRSPVCILAATIKGKGVSFMENKLAWHYKSPNAEQLEIALQEVMEAA